jgi:hypothetical protein
MNVQHTALLLLALATATAQAEPEWLPRSLPADDPIDRITRIDSAAYFEVPVSRLGAAEKWLAESGFISLEPQLVTFLGRAGFKCHLSASLFLTRALFSTGGTGEFYLRWSGPDLVVAHTSLGQSSTPERTALVVCLERPPREIYLQLGGGK